MYVLTSLSFYINLRNRQIIYKYHSHLQISRLVYSSISAIEFMTSSTNKLAIIIHSINIFLIILFLNKSSI